MVRCEICGLLCIRARNTRELIEVEKSIRDEGVIPKSTDAIHRQSLPISDPFPICFAQVPINAEYQERIDKHQKLSDSVRQGTFREIITKDRKCDELGCFIEWMQGFSPKEHVEMNMLENQRQWQRQMELDAQKWREDQAERDRKWRQEDARAIERRHLVNLAVTALIAMAMIIGTLVAAKLLPFFDVPNN